MASRDHLSECFKGCFSGLSPGRRTAARCGSREGLEGEGGGLKSVKIHSDRAAVRDRGAAPRLAMAATTFDLVSDSLRAAIFSPPSPLSVSPARCIPLSPPRLTRPSALSLALSQLFRDFSHSLSRHPLDSSTPSSSALSSTPPQPPTTPNHPRSRSTGGLFRKQRQPRELPGLRSYATLESYNFSS